MYCTFNSSGISEILYSHYAEIHPVSIAVEPNGTKILFQNQKVIGYLGISMSAETCKDQLILSLRTKFEHKDKV